MVVVAYDPDLPDDSIGALNQLAGEVEDVVVTPHPEDMGSPITLTAYGVLQRCESVTAPDVAAFRDAHATTSED